MVSEENFPSLCIKNKYDQYEYLCKDTEFSGIVAVDKIEDCDYIEENAVQRLCLDKQKVRDVLKFALEKGLNANMTCSVIMQELDL